MNITILGRYPKEIKVAGSSETSVAIYQATRRHVPKRPYKSYMYVVRSILLDNCLRGVVKRAALRTLHET